MFRLTRAFVIAAAVSSSVLCAPVPQDVGKPISTGQAANSSASASSVFGTTPQEPNYQSHPTSLCIVPALAKGAGFSQGQEQLTVQQAIQLCPEASTIAVASKNSKRSIKAPEVSPPAPSPSPSPEPYPEAPHPARSVDDHPPNAEVPPKPATSPLPGAPQPHAARDLPPQPSPIPQPSPEPVSAAPQPHGARDLPHQPEPVPSPSPSPVPQPDREAHHVRSNAEQPPKDVIPPQPSSKPEPSPVPQPDIHPAVARSEGEHHPEPQPSPQPEPQPGTPKPVTARSAAKDEVPPHAQPLPATIPRPSQLV